MDPCGMWVEMLHSFYRMPVLIIVAGKRYRTWIRWYRAPKNAKRLPFPTVFGTDVWQNTWEQHYPPGPGEIGHPRVWDPGRNVDGFLGQCYVGDPEWFMTGILPADVLTDEPPWLPVCCKVNPVTSTGSIIIQDASSVVQPPTPATSSGAIVLAGQSVWGPPYTAASSGLLVVEDASIVRPPPSPATSTGALVLGTVPPAPMPSPSPSASGGGGQFPETEGCDACPDGAAVTYVVHLRGIADGSCLECASMNGDLLFTWHINCTWYGPTLLQCHAATGHTELDIAGDLVLLDLPWATYQAARGGWDCLSPIRLYPAFTATVCTWPAFIDLEPAP